MSNKTPTEPWRPASVLVVPEGLKEQFKGKRIRWVRKADLDRKMAEGWKPVNAEDMTDRTIIDGAQMDSNVTKRELILCEMPEEMAKSRDAYYAEKTQGALDASVNEYKDKAGGDNETYGKITISKEGG